MAHRDLAALDGLRQTRPALSRRVDILRLLGRLEFVGSHWVRDLIFPDATHRMTAWRTLHALHADRLIWCAPVDVRKLPSTTRTQRAMPKNIGSCWLSGGRCHHCP